MKAIKSRTRTKHLTTTLSMLLFLLAGSLYSQNLNSIHDNPGASANTIPSSQIGFEVLQSAAVPFDLNTLISYSMPVAMDVEFKVYDKLGREMITLVNEIQGPGSHTINLKAANLKAGVYFYMLTMGNYTEAKKIAIVK